MGWIITYAIGFVVSFVILSIWEARRAKKYSGYDDAALYLIFLYSLIWPFLWIYTLINLLFG
jgi:hypothetical protein